MKTKIFSILTIFLMVVAGCSVPDYLPKTKEIDVNQYGSYIKISRIDGSAVNGELLAADTISLVVLVVNNGQKLVTIVPAGEVKDFKLRYAQPKNYWWAVIPYTLSCATHGWFAIITAPVNLVATLAIALVAENSFVYNVNDIRYADLKMFARFPGGIPPNIDLSANNKSTR